MRRSGFLMAKRLVLDALRSGYWSVEVRGALSEKNLLGTGTVSGEQRARLIASCGGDRYAASPHHRDPEIECHIFRPVDPLWIE
jgi:hypothetical protein